MKVSIAVVFPVLLLVAPYLCASPVHLYGGRFDLLIPAEPCETKGKMEDAKIYISDHYILQNLDVAITITHSSVFDLQIFLKSPTQTRICLNMYNVDEYFEGRDYIQTIFDDEAAIAIEQAQPPFTGRFRPLRPYELSCFHGEQVFGWWQLQVYDFWPSNAGKLTSFELMIATPEPAPFIFLIAAAGISMFLRLS
ncbi:MAG: proprotein convertase P-domain-containing protein [Sedimentisphaerales bacterium]|nr:proprotein convertase P-domain-containing protein [Sedimentisphaerales bacterium]